jgi:tripartite-type tricarboxylate transporter receptor subunit TctC
MRTFPTVARMLLATLLTVACGAAVAAWPERPVRLIVPYAPGGSTDAAARIVADTMTKQLGQSVLVENRPGASGFIGAAQVARAAPDGHTLLFTGSGIASAPSLKDVPFELRKDFTPISRVVSSQFSILVNPAKLPFKTLKELLDYVKANPGKLDFACSGAMTAAHFALEGFRQAGGLEFTTVQYNGNAPADLAMMSGQPAAGIDAAFSAKAAIESGRLRALAVTGSKRSSTLPDVPTAAEAGLPGYEAGFSLVLFGPAGIPKPVVDQIYHALEAALKEPATVAKLEAQGYEIVGSKPEVFAVDLKREIDSSAKIVSAFRSTGQVK